MLIQQYRHGMPMELITSLFQQLGTSVVTDFHQAQADFIQFPL